VLRAGGHIIVETEVVLTVLFNHFINKLSAADSVTVASYIHVCQKPLTRETDAPRMRKRKEANQLFCMIMLSNNMLVYVKFISWRTSL
jgi:hypothetical protein